MAVELLKSPIVRREQSLLKSHDYLNNHKTGVLRPIRIGEPIVFGMGGNASLYLFSDDWHASELKHRWTRHHVARIAFNAIFDNCDFIEIDLVIFLERSWLDLNFALSLNGQKLNFEIDEHVPTKIRAWISDPLMAADTTNILIIHSIPARVCDVIESPDDRQIGVGVQQIRFLRSSTSSRSIDILKNSCLSYDGALSNHRDTEKSSETKPVLLSFDDNPLFVIRGDIISTTGYARAARALANIISENNEVFGVSIHEDPSDNSQSFPGKLLKDADLREIARSRRLVIINHTPPNDFFPVLNACNIGLFYWETDAIPRSRFWPEHIASMDAIWAPTQFVADFVASCSYDGPTMLVTWAHAFDEMNAAGNAEEVNISVEILSTMGNPGAGVSPEWRTDTVGGLRRDGRDIFLAIQSLSPRKGLPVLISEWHRHVRSTPGANSVLLLKLNFRHAHGIKSDPREHLVELLRRFGVPDCESIRIGLISSVLDDSDMRRLTVNASALVVSSYGEGFGGPIVEALSLGVPVIASRHTGIVDLLPADYPLQYASRPVRVQLRDLIDIYPPASNWYVPEHGAVAKVLAAFEAMSPTQRGTALSAARKHARAFCETSVVRTRVRDAVSALPWRPISP